MEKDPKTASLINKKGANFKSLSRPIILLGAFILHAVLEFISMGIQTNVRYFTYLNYILKAECRAKNEYLNLSFL